MEPAAIGFIGAGQMARALARGFVAAGLARPEQIVACDPAAAARERFGHDLRGATFCQGGAEVLAAAPLVFLAVKPQQMPQVLRELWGRVGPEHLLVSVAAGVTLRQLCEGLGTGRVIRVMPNTPTLVGSGASAYALGPAASPEDAQRVEQLLSAVGLAIRVEEHLLDAVTGLSGSGPAFVYLMIEALSDGGVRAGLPREVATALAAQTVRGAAEMVLQTGEHPGVLKDRVASPAGTTIAGLHVLEERGVRGALMAAVLAATQRAAELGRGGPS
jgi:pyrroline-5-carboxylate reductase